MLGCSHCGGEISNKIPHVYFFPLRTNLQEDIMEAPLYCQEAEPREGAEPSVKSEEQNLIHH